MGVVLCVSCAVLRSVLLVDEGSQPLGHVGAFDGLARLVGELGLEVLRDRLLLPPVEPGDEPWQGQLQDGTVSNNDSRRTKARTGW